MVTSRQVMDPLQQQRQEGNDPDAYAAAVKESADAIQGDGATELAVGAIHRGDPTLLGPADRRVCRI